MSKSVLKTNIKRNPKFLYYCGTDSNGNIEIFEAELNRKGGTKKENRKKKKQSK